MNLETQIKTELKKLLAGLAHQRNLVAMEAHKALYSIGSPTLPFLKDTLFRLDLSGTTGRSRIKVLYVSGLMNLIHDIDEDESKKVSNQLIQNGCSSIITQRIKSINEFTLNDFFQYEIKGINIFEHKEIQPHQDIRKNLERWLENVPDDDTKEIDRIYVVPQKDQHYAANYTPIFYNIKLVWGGPYPRMNPVYRFVLSWMEMTSMEMTLYHEIGHHFHRHSFGHIVEQEEEADNYSGRIYVSNRPVLKILVYCFRVVRLFKRRLTFKDTA